MDKSLYLSADYILDSKIEVGDVSLFSATIGICCNFCVWLRQKALCLYLQLDTVSIINAKKNT